MTITNDSLQARIQSAFPDEQVTIGGDGYHFEATIVSKQFVGKRAIARQQLVYAAVNDWLSSGELHALSMRCLTPDEAK